MIQLCQARLYVADLWAGKPLFLRHPKWPKVRAEHLSRNPTCYACGSKHDLEVHHIVPFWKCPELELVPSNLRTLDRGHHFDCHGHDWHAIAPNQDDICAVIRLGILTRTREAA